MLSKCANPNCDTQFQYLRTGRLFQIEFGSGPRLVTEKKQPFRVEYFWLCSHCADNMTLKYERGKGVTAIPLQSAQRAAS